MDFLTDDEAAKWMETYPTTADASFDRRLPRSKDAGIVSIYIEPLTPPRVMFVARAGVSWIQNEPCGESSVLVWVREHGVWKPGEHLHLYETLRSAYPGAGSLDDRPALLAWHDEVYAAVSFLSLALFFGWGVLVASEIWDRTLNAHNGHLWLTTRWRNDIEETRAWLPQ